MKNTNMRNIMFSILCIFAAVLLMSNSSCSRGKEKKADTHTDDPKMQEKRDSIAYAEKEAQGFLQATVIDNTGLDGCRFMLQLQSGKKLQPTNLEEKYLKDGKKVWVKYVIQKDAMSVCMAGDVVNITVIEERK
jgi:hypothetical protein